MLKKTADWENRYILIRIYLPAVKHLNIQKIFFINRIELPKYCCSIAQVIVTSFTKLVYMFFFEDSALQDQPYAPLETVSHPRLQESRHVSRMEALCFCRQL